MLVLEWQSCVWGCEVEGTRVQLGYCDLAKAMAFVLGILCTIFSDTDDGICNIH